MIAAFFPLKKLRRNGRYLLFGAILLVGLVAVYHEMVAAKAWSSDTGEFFFCGRLSGLNKCLAFKLFFLKVMHHFN